MGSTVELASVMTDGPGLVSLKGNITTSGQQSIGDQGLLTNDVILTSTAAGHMTFQTTVIDSAVGAHRLMIRTAGTTRFNAAVGSAVALKSVTTDDFGTTQLNGDVITTNAQTYGVLSLVYSQDGSRLLSRSYDKTARVWEVDSDKRSPDRQWA